MALGMLGKLEPHIETIERVASPKRIYLNEKLSYSIKGPQHVGFFGLTGSGKTYTTLIALSQYPCSIFFDPQARAIDIIKELGESKSWKFYQISDYIAKDSFQMNARDIHSRAFETLFFRLRSSELKLKDQLNNYFFNVPKEQRTYALLESIIGLKYPLVWNQLKKFLHPRDEGLHLQELQSFGHTIIDFSQCGSQSYAPAVIIESIIAWRAERKYKNTPLAIGMDECEVYCKKHSATGLAFGSSAARGRIYGISTIVSGTGKVNFESNLWENLKVFFLFSIMDVGPYRSKGLNISFADYENFPAHEKGWFYYININESILEPQKSRANLHYQKLRNAAKRAKEGPIIKIKQPQTSFLLKPSLKPYSGML